jgi:contractile injection system tube protein
MGLEQATIKIVQPLSGTGATLYAPYQANGIPIRFNPNEYSLVRNQNYADVTIPGLATSVVQFIRGETQTLQLEIYLDRTDRVAYVTPASSSGTGGSSGATPSGGGAPSTATFDGIDTELQLLRLLVTIDSGLHAPPVCEFHWGKLTFRGVVTSYTEKFQMFDEAGLALRARVTLALKKYEPPTLQARAAANESADRTKTRVVREGERIDAIAADVYGDPVHWPVLARANGLARPRILVPGSVLIVPPL